MFLGKCTTLHFYEYVPRQLEKAPYPVIVFLHGSFGNFRGYMWVLRELSDAAGVAIVAPTYGSGNWCLDSDSSVLKTLHDYFLSNPEFDKKRMYLAGLSNGGAGVTRGIRNVGRDYRGFILISPVIEPEIISSEGFAENLKGKPVLIIHGENDPRIPARIVRLREALMKTRIPEVSLRSHYYKEEDHFLMFSQRALLTRDISTWLRETAGLND
jgi:pimeloyl-ACP methyl ester carboxylesterase